ncbi:MAG: divergent polysaccharide deacetylase family protein [Rhizomicrobium sp.]
MYRLKPIRVTRPPRPPRALFAGATAAFWIVLALAAGIGGGRAVAGFPLLVSAIAPPGVIAARASDAPRTPFASLTVTGAIAPSRYAPQVLYPLVSRELPDWLSARRADPPLAAAPPVKNPKIAVVIDDLGADLAHTDRAIALPKPVTLSFLPYADATPWLSASAARAGHEILVHMPMEAEGEHNPGPQALTVALTAGEIQRRLVAALRRVPDAIGINNHMGSRFTVDRAALIPVAEELGRRHLFFFDSRTTAATEVVAVAHAFGVASAGRDVFLDDEQTAGAVDAQLKALEARARVQGIAIAIGHPHDVTLSALAAWTQHAAERGFLLVPLSEAIRLKTERDARLALAARP